MAPAAAPPAIPTSALALELDAFVAVRAAVSAGIADLRATFEYSFTGDARFLVLAGLEPLLDALERVRIKPDEAAWLESVGAIDEPTKRRLADARFLCDVDAAREGSIVFPGVPVLTVEGPFWQAQLVGAFVESALGEATLAATKVARCTIAAGGAGILEAGSASAHRLGGAPLLARAAYIAGAHATTNALAGRRYGLPVRAIQPMSIAAAATTHDGALAAWLSAAPHRAIVRLDPRDEAGSLARLIPAVKARSKHTGWDDDTVGVAITATSAVEVARDVRAAFADAGLPEPTVIVSGPIDEAGIMELRRQNAPIDAFCVSTHVAEDALARSRYALVAIEQDGVWTPRLASRASVASGGDPGRKVVLRYVDQEGRPAADVAHLANERHLRAKDGKFVEHATGLTRTLRGAASSAPLLTNVMRAGKRVSATEETSVIRSRCEDAVLTLAPRHKRLVLPAPYPVGTTAAVAALALQLLAT